MSALVLDGKSLAAQTEAELLARVERLKVNSGGKTPILATILVGDDPASATYVKMKGNACRRVGMESLAVEMPASTTTEQLLVKSRSSTQTRTFTASCCSILRPNKLTSAPVSMPSPCTRTWTA